jgi:SAM-dependent methyltransferase
MKLFKQLGHSVTGVDRSAEALSVAGHWGETLLADVENAPWPLLQGASPRAFDVVVVTNYLWRPLFPVIAESLAPGGILIYETFARGNETVGKPSRADFLLEPGELLRAFTRLKVIAFEDGFLEAPARFVQRLVAVAQPSAVSPSHPPARFPL